VSNLVERLREQGALHSRNCGSSVGPSYCVVCAAADRIEELENALMPFATFGKWSTNRLGWDSTSVPLKDIGERFSPSDFYTAFAVMAGKALEE
jgi:hypothetical protein